MMRLIIDKLLIRLPIFVHNWGGLGSQLFSLSFILKILQRNPERKVKLIHHTGGVTRRELEESLFAAFAIPFKIVDDFKAPLQQTENKSKKRFGIRQNYLVKLAQMLNLVVFQSGNDIVLKPWTLIVRGHYYRMEINDFVLQTIRTFLEGLEKDILNASISGKDMVLFHYRLGDLLTLSEKSPISEERVLEVLAEVLAQNHSQVVVSSDSPEIAVGLIEDSLLWQFPHDKTKILAFEGNVQGFLSASLKVPVFIGTNSKISVWAALLREVENKNGKVSYLPTNMLNDLLMIYPKSRSTFGY